MRRGGIEAIALLHLQQMPHFHFEAAVDERSGHLLGEDVQCQNALALQVAEDLMPPNENVGGGRGAPELLFVWMLDLDGVEQISIAEEHAHRLGRDGCRRTAGWSTIPNSGWSRGKWGETASSRLGAAKRTRFDAPTDSVNNTDWTFRMG